MGKISLSVFIPERTGVDITFPPNHPNGILPGAGGILRAHHHDTPVRVSEIDIEPAFVKADGRRPDAVSVLYRGAEHRVRIICQRRPHLLPVHKVPGMQDGKSRKTVEGRGCHIVVLPHAANVWVRIIQMQDGVTVCKVRSGRTRALTGGQKEARGQA